MTRVERLDRELRALARLLRHRSRTARQLAEALGCSKPTVYARIRRLRANGFDIQEFTNGAKKPGPVPAYFAIRGRK